ncbi:MAG: hypothetical protein AABW91_01390 [Nanoarchaeota archaeon]
MKNASRDNEKEKNTCFLTSIKESSPTELIAMIYGVLTYPYILAAQQAYGLYNLISGFKG